jgi:glycosyltransferase involved in cell wall biosynthesis
MARLGVYTDYIYSQRGGQAYAERAFALFVAALAPRLERTVVIGRLDPAGEGRYPLGDVELAPLPHYPSLSHTIPAIRGMLGSLRPFWRALDGLDCVWILGPHPLAFPFALIARLRGREVILGVRQDSVSYFRSRHPGSRLKAALARAMDLGFRLLARRWPVVVVGPGIAEHYRASPRLCEISVSLIAAREIEPPEQAAERGYDGDLVALSVGRLEAEKNPLALADVLAALRERDPRWRMVICGEGELRSALERRLEELGVADAAELRGYVDHGPELAATYREAHALALVSWTEGLPQVLFEAFAAGLPVAATAVGGIPAAVGDAALLVPAGDPEAMAAALARIGEDAGLREDLIRAGNALVHANTIETETERVAAFISAASAADH